MLHREMRAHQGVFVVELGAGEEVEADRVDEDGGAVGGDDDIFGVLVGCQVEFVLEAGAAAGEHFDSQRLGLRVGCQDLRDLGGGGRGQAECVNGLAHGDDIAGSGLGLKGRAVYAVA